MNELAYVKGIVNKYPNWARKAGQNNSDEFVKFREYAATLTPFLSGVSVAQRIWHIMNDIYDIPVCKHCGINQVKFIPNKQEYQLFCSVKCLTNSSYKKEKSVKTSLEKYGVEHHMKTMEFKDSMREFNRAKYGKDYFFQTEIFKESSKSTQIERYGEDHHLKTINGISAQEATNLIRYGVRRPSQNKEVQAKIKRTVQTNYGVNHISQRDMLFTSLELLNNPVWLTEMNHTRGLMIKEIADILDVDASTVSDYFHKHRITIKYHNKSVAEKSICDFLESHNVQVVRNSRSIIPPFELDFYLPDYKVAIEFNGLYWHSDWNVPRTYHQDKLEASNHNGIRLLTVFENEWSDNMDLVKKKILHVLGISNAAHVFARKCVVEMIGTTEKSRFFDYNHIQGNGPSSINYGLRYNGELVACMGFIRNNDGSFTLNRYATSCRVIGGFTKLLKRFEKDFGTPKIISFADLRWSNGEIYRTSGFVLDSVIKPDYFWNKAGRLYHKFNFRHKGMKVKLKDYDPRKSESVNMIRNGFYRIWDCGKLKFIRNG